ncbi:GntR family transcriptional regulator [Isoptericola sp. S6320L]|uniref:FadR/GntR family transcriptional regulator n=1 Tax=Isoptericola sp. S6320L TaxID=2926411 RepID=UPI001FF2387C|nr:GntR family transcriptional regulator [Isoptericola sp. S6320L]MCK0115962.1 GntR family transcriptional regulator [Isoptericola sp. S6320L]
MTSVEIPPVVPGKQPLAVALAARLERMIATGELGPGARLPAERELARQLDVSRTTLREAMNKLEEKGLVERRQGRGTRVVDRPEEARQILGLHQPGATQSVTELRTLVEPSVAALAAARATRANQLQLADVLARTTSDLTAQQSLERDTEFHLLLAHATLNPLVTALHGLMTEWTLAQRRLSHGSPEGRALSLQGHREILAAVEAHDADAAYDAMRRHLADVGASS